MMTVILIVAGALGTVSKGLEKNLKELEIEIIQIKALLRLVRILRNGGVPVR